ncbi:MAG TPA: 2-amino-4-hydroxy-6-hydroxymethyldihydropteridine diphosphokinase [Acidimicrobiales bacterium]|nr:2-amino-4-hydroxy-6-hydroxymethyldihydropteridine diphosphokinase [Acidimicrobiales bacterium]
MTEKGARTPPNVTDSGVAERRRVFLGLGSNLGDRLGTLRRAVAALPDVVAVSPVYETEPVGGPEGQPAYLNLVVELSSDLSPHALLDVARRLEDAAGRVRAERFGPRNLDVDVLLVGDEAVDDADLTVPHPRMHERRFVLAPLADLAPDLVRPGWAESSIGGVRAVGRLEDDERHPPDHLLGPEREETTT